MTDNTEKFNGKAELYQSARPGYSLELIERLFNGYGFSPRSVIADVGSGTGIFAEQLLMRGCTVYGVEPNADMRRVAEERLKKYGNFISTEGSADCTRLAESSVDIVTAAQAFHWFDAEKFAAECRRVLKGDKQVVLAYNRRDENAPVNRDCFELFSRTCQNFRGFGGGMDEGRIYDFFGGKVEKLVFEHNLTLDRDRFINRCLSGSYAPTKADSAYGEFIGGINNLFGKYSENGIIAIANYSVAYIGYLI